MEIQSISFLLLLLAAAVAAGEPVNPFTTKAATIRYWNRRIPNNRPHPSFLLSKLSPLTAAASTALAADPSSLCYPAAAPAGVLCAAPSLSAAVTSSSSSHGGAFSNYANSNFSNYGTGGVAGAGDRFDTYSPDLNIPVDSFRRYERDSTGRNDSFANYEPDGNVVTANFTSYASAATGGAGEFSTYAKSVNVPELKFTNYDAAANGRSREFKEYSTEANAGDESFSGYGRKGNGLGETFSSYAGDSNVVGNTFSNYGDDGNGATDEFKSYGGNGNVPENTFRSYGAGGNAGSDRFSAYRVDANVGDDFFTSYAKGENGGAAGFDNYGKSFNPGSDSFRSYGDGGNPNHQVGFTGYFGDNTTFKEYASSGVSFKEYHNASVAASVGQPAPATEDLSADEHVVPHGSKNRWVVEPGKFFREKELTTGNVMPMPDIRDKMPPRTFLPQSVSSKIPFNADAVNAMFGVQADTAMGKAVASTMADCARAPSRGETKRCVSSAEDLIDFAVSVLGSDIVVRSTENVNGSGGDILIGDVKGVNGGAVTKSVSCHQSLFPYLVYYCHSVPDVRVYEADILAVDRKAKINHGVAICHLDTSDWGATHGAFIALGGSPGEHEVCHWIFEGDMTWTVAD